VVVGASRMRDNPRVPSTRLHDDDAGLTPDQAPDPVDGDAPAEPAGDPAASGEEPAAPSRARRAEVDAVCAAAVDLARASAEELADQGTVGDHLGVAAEGERLVVHSFACLSRGYRGWRWAVSVARAPRSRTATVCEVVLLPAADALLPPEWVPWSQRLAPGDLGPGDELPYRADDPYLDPGYTVTGDDDADSVALWELGLGRARVLSREGRDAAADRWYRGSHGPTADVAVHAAASCSSCAYLLHVAGGLRQMFGVCANEWSPSDGKVVSLDHGCGAHSETDAPVPEAEPLPEPILDDTGIEPVVIPRGEAAAAEAPVADAPVDAAPEAPAEAAPEALAEEAVAAPEAAEVAPEVMPEVTAEVVEVTGTVAPDEEAEDEEPDPEAPAHDVPDPETPAHDEPEDPETPAHELTAVEGPAADAPPEEPDPETPAHELKADDGPAADVLPEEPDQVQ
jgi:hypothetical protein